MSKELEILKELGYLIDEVSNLTKYVYEYDDSFDSRLEFICNKIEEIKSKLQPNLQRLESIDNAKPSEALGILETFENDGLLNKEIGAISYNQIWLKNQIEVLKQELLKAQEQERLLKSGDLSDGYHTFNQLYYQRCVLFASLVRLNKDRSWKSFKHSDGKYCFDSNGEWFIVGIDTPIGSYTYHYEKKYWDLFECQELECGKEWDGHTEEDITRLLSLPNEQEKESKIEILKEYRKDYLSRLKNLEEYSSKQDRVLEIIKEKGVDIGYFKICKTLDDYNDYCQYYGHYNKKLTQEEFELLKGYFK